MAQRELNDCCYFLKSKIFQEKNEENTTNIAQLSISENHLNCFKIIVKNSRNFLIQEKISEAIVVSGNLNFLKFFDSQGFSWKSESLCWLAAQNGHLNIIKWAIEKNCPFNAHHCMYAAISLDRIHILLFFVKTKGYAFNQTMCAVAACDGELEMLKFLRANKCPWDEETCSLAALEGHLDVLKWAFENGCPWDERVCKNAAKYGHLECLRYAHENGCEWNKNTCAKAAENGQLECLVYAHENGCEWDKNTCENAAENGHLECLVYAHENGCEWDERTCAYAAEYGQLECLVYAHENGCPWDKQTCYFAALNGHLECMAYAHTNGCPCIHNTGKLKKYSTELDTTTDNEDIQCGICYENLNKVEFKPCNHKLCISCSNTLINNQGIETQCPFCRTKVETNVLLDN